MARPTKAGERKEEILAAFESCLLTKSFDQTTLQDVANAAGIPRSLVRHFIGNRDEMMNALIDRLLARAQQQVDDLQPFGSVDRVMTLLMETVFDDPTTNTVIMELWHVALRDAELRTALSNVYGDFIEKVAEMIATSDESPLARERAFAGVSLAFGAAFFRYLGLTPPSIASLYDTERAILTGQLVLSATEELTG